MFVGAAALLGSFSFVADFVAVARVSLASATA